MDLFALSGKHYLLMVDKYSGFPMYKLLRGETTAQVTAAMSEFCTWLGWPETVRADYGPCFRTGFDEFLKSKGANRERSSAHNPASNGMAEQGVQRVKNVIRKAVMAKQSVEQAVSEFRNTAMQGQLSPAEMFFGRRLRGELPELRTHVDVLGGANKHEDMRSAYLGAGATIRSSPPLVVGEYVWMQNHKSLKWNIAAKVIEVRPGNKSYWVMVVTGETFLRNRMFLRKWNDKNVENAPGMQFHQKKQYGTQQEFVSQPRVLTRGMAKNAEVNKIQNARSMQLRHRNSHGQQLQHRNLLTLPNTTSQQLQHPNLRTKSLQTSSNTATLQLRNQNFV